MSVVPPHVVAVDLGTSGVKAALVTFDGTITAWAGTPVELIVLPGGGAEQRPDDWWSGLVLACAELGRQAPEAMASVRAVCCSTQGEGTIPVDAAGEPLHNALLWMDMRGAPYLRRQFGGRPSIRGLSAARMARWVRLTGGAPSPTGKDPAAHMLWLKHERPDVYARTHTMLNVLDFLNLRLTGRFVATWESILTAWVTDNRAPRAIRYHPALVADCGIDAAKLPDLVPATEVLGPLTAAAAEALGLSRDVVVVAGAIDNSAAAIGAGTVAFGAAHLHLGTSSWIAAHVPTKKTDLRSGIASLPCAIPGRYLMTAMQSCAGGNFTWLRDNVLYHRDQLFAEAGHKDGTEDVLAIFSEIARDAPPGANGVLYLPWIYGERAPVDDLDLRAGLLGLSLEHTRADIVRAFYEGIALNTRWLAGAVSRFLGEPLRELPVIGGGAASDVLCRITADVLGVRIRQLEDPRGANARGAAWIAGVALGELDWDDVPTLVRVRATYDPDASTAATYDDLFADFKDAHRRLAPFYAARAARGPGRPGGVGQPGSHGRQRP